MRIWTPVCREKQYFLTIYFRETGSANFIRVGSKTESFGGRRDFAGQIGRKQIEVTDGDGSIEFYPGAKILGVVLHDQAGFDLQYERTLMRDASFHEVELVRPSEIVVMPADLAKEVAGQNGNNNFKKQVEVLKGKRKPFVK